ncbi:MAG TPA: spondin domain-containing protein [Alphaproteobacteria bacterium]
MTGRITGLACAACALAVATGSVQAMPLQMRDTGPAMGARQSNTYHGPGVGALRGGQLERGGQAGASESTTAAVPAAAPAWMVEQEVMSVRDGGTEFVVRIENVSPADAMRYSDGSSDGAAFSHVAYAVHDAGWPIFEPGEATLPASGLEQLAEDGNVRPIQANLEQHADVVESGIVYRPVGDDKDNELWPGHVYEFHLTADAGENLSFAAMLIQSNDVVVGPKDGYLPLFDSNGRPMSGDVTDRIAFFDAGTEVNEDPKFGPNVGVNQKWLNAGETETKPVRAPDDGFAWPAPAKVLKVTIQPVG